jgi:glycosyltransferase involved in cell wall biosynthesis
MKEYRSFWAELPRVHQIDISPAETIDFSYRVSPALRVLSSHHHHHYHRTIYDQLAGRVVDGESLPLSHAGRVCARPIWHASELRKRCDIFHLHWPEKFGPDLARHLDIIESLAAASVPVVWTQHNLTPHSKDQKYVAIFEAWAAAARGVIHHSCWGRDQSLKRYKFASDAIHQVIPHPHFGCLARQKIASREEVERDFQLRSGMLRLGIVGAPRAEKLVSMAMSAFAKCGRDDMELLVLSLDATETAPCHPGIVARRYQLAPWDLYHARLSAIDLLVLPFASDGMLTTGLVGDVVAHGIPALISDWPFLGEVLGEAGIPYGRKEQDLVERLRSLDCASLARARAASIRLQETYDPSRVAAQTFELLETVAGARPGPPGKPDVHR